MVTPSILNSSDVIFPVLTKSPPLEIHGFHYLTVYDAPSAYYFTPKKSEDTILKEVIAGESLAFVTLNIECMKIHLYLHAV